MNLTTQAVNDLVVLFAGSGTASAVANSVADSNSRVAWHHITDVSTWTGEHVTMWWGTVMSVGATTVAVTWSNVPTFAYMRLDSWNGGPGEGWGVGASGVTGRSTSGGNATYPSLSSSTDNAMYEGFLLTSASPLVSGSGDGFTHNLFNNNTEVVWKTDITGAGSPYLPAAATGTSFSFNGVAAIFFITASSPHIDVAVGS